jgi:hypothetical protein
MRSLTATIEKNLEKEEHKMVFEVVKGNAVQAFMDYKSAVEELMYLLEEPDMTLRTANNIATMLERMFSSAAEFEEVKDAMATALAPFDNYDGFDSYDYFATKSEQRRSFRNGYISSIYMDLLANAMPKNVTRPLKVVDPYTYDGSRAFMLMDRYDKPLQVYGIDTNMDILLGDKSRFERLVVGELKGSMVTNDVFDVLLLVPPVSLEKKGKNVIEKIERDYLHKTINYLRPDGLMIYSIPLTHMYKEVCQYLAKNLKDIQIRLDGIHVYICGYRNTDKNRETDKDVLIALRTLQLNRGNDCYSLDNPLNSFTLPLPATQVLTFRGSKLDETEFAAMYEKSNATETFLKEQRVDKLSDNAKSPLLPFNVGQLGLILTSGCLDGVIDEGNGICHAVKGRVIKKRDVQKEVDNEKDKIDVTEIVANRVEINAFLADGTYKCLA